MTIYVIEVYDDEADEWKVWREDIFGSYRAMNIICALRTQELGSGIRFRITQT